MKKLLVTGISGFLGWHIAQVQQTNWEVIGTYCNNPVQLDGIHTIALDITKEEDVRRLINILKPDAILHIAALSNANFCQANPERSKQVNLESSLLLAELAKINKLPFIFTSTDLVFEGDRAPYAPYDEPISVCTYGQHKVEAEHKISRIYPEATIARLPLMYGIPEYGNNFFSNWIEQLKKGQSIKAFTDEFRTPAHAKDVAKGLFLLLDKGVSGVWHLGGRERLSRYEFAQRMTEALGLPPNLIQPVKQAELTLPAPRPSDVSLDSNKSYAIGYAPSNLEAYLHALTGSPSPGN